MAQAVHLNGGYSGCPGAKGSTVSEAPDYILGFCSLHKSSPQIPVVSQLPVSWLRANSFGWRSISVHIGKVLPFNMSMCVCQLGLKWTLPGNVDLVWWALGHVDVCVTPANFNSGCINFWKYIGYYQFSTDMSGQLLISCRVALPRYRRGEMEICCHSCCFLGLLSSWNSRHSISKNIWTEILGKKKLYLDNMDAWWPRPGTGQ